MTYEVQVETLVYGGEALGRLPDGRAVFVPFVLPGETVRIRLVEDKPRYARAELLEVLEPSPERVAALCIHFGLCGGCHYQHMPYPAQLRAKQEIVRDQLIRIGKFEDPLVMETVPSPEPYYYRNYVQFSLTQEGRLGYHEWQSDQVFTAQECHLPQETINRVWPQLDMEGSPEVVRVGLRLGAEDDVQITLESEEIEAPEMSVEDLPVSVVHLSPAGTLVLAGSEYLVMEVLGRPFRVTADSFFQVNTAMAAALVEKVLEELGASGILNVDAVVMDVFCGVGLFSSFLAPRVGRLVGVESSPSAAEDFVANLDEFDNVELYEATAEEALAALARDRGLQPDAVVLDPPRGGLEKEALDALITLAPQVIVYVSCDPATMARDGKRLNREGWSLKRVTPFDLFPQTFHIETVSVWERAGE